MKDLIASIKKEFLAFDLIAKIGVIILAGLGFVLLNAGLVTVIALWSVILS